MIPTGPTRSAALVAALATALAAGRPASAQPASAEPAEPPAAVYAVSIGYNGLPAGRDVAGLEPLRFADDDAAGFHSFIRTIARRSFLLTTFDRETQRRFPGLVTEARPPSVLELVRVVAELGRLLAIDQRQGRRPSVLLFFSGHGSLGGEGGAALTLVDGDLTHERLYQDVLARLPGAFVHLLLDACHAEAVVRPRDARAEPVDLAQAQIDRYLRQRSLERFPQVGAILASTSSAQAHEWDVYEGGIFTHELLSGLRGGADVDGDGRIEYSEIGAFLQAANRAVVDPRARLHAVVHPPRAQPRVPIVALGEARGVARLVGRPSSLGRFFVEAEPTGRIADLHPEPGARIELLVPAAQTIYLRTGKQEAELSLPAGAVARFETLTLRAASSRGRGAIESSLRRGLFAAEFGRSYYRGYVDSRRDLVPVAEAVSDLLDVAPPPVGARPSRLLAWSMTGLAAGLGVVSAGFARGALEARGEYDGAAVTERRAAALEQRYRRDVALSVGLGVAAAAAGALAIHLFTRETP